MNVPVNAAAVTTSYREDRRAGLRKRLAPITYQAKAADPESNGQLSASPKRVILAERRDFVRGCLSSWLDSFCPEFETLVVTEIDTCEQAGAPGQVAAVIIGASAAVLSDTWLHAQITWLRANNPDVPILLIGEVGETHSAEMLANKLGLQGYIPTSHSMELAAAALRLIIAGGTYFPRVQDRDPRLTQVLMGQTSSCREASSAKLTPREQAVLNMLCQGLPNKVIAHRLGMALGTVKIHLHNIIKKLNVQNRTEAALSASRLQSGPTSTNPGQSIISFVAASPVAGAEAFKLYGTAEGSRNGCEG